MNKGAQAGMTLVEMMVAIGCGSLVFLVLGAVSLYSARSFSSMVEYSELNRSSRLALDNISQEIRQSRGLKSYSQSSNACEMVFNVDVKGTKTFSLAYDKPTQTLTQTWPGEKTNVLSQDCTAFSFKLFQKSPIPNSFNFAPTTDAKECKLVQLDWTCQRDAAPTIDVTDSVQTMKIVIRKKPD